MSPGDEKPALVPGIENGGKDQIGSQFAVARLLAAGVIVLTTATYLFLVILGKVDEHHRLGTAEAQIAAASALFVLLLLTPEFYGHLQSVKFPGGEVTFLKNEVRKVQATQERQQAELKTLRGLLSKGLSGLQLYHFLMVGLGKGHRYRWDAGLKRDINRLIEVKLLYEKTPGTIVQIEENSVRNLTDVVALTPEGDAYFGTVAPVASDVVSSTN